MQVKRSTLLWSPTGETPASAKRNKDVSEESAPDSSGEQPNWFLRRSSKFAVHIIMLVDIASYNVPNEILLLVEFIFHEGKMCLFSTLCDRRFSLSVVYSCWICCPFYNACLLKIMYKSVIIILNHCYFCQPASKGLSLACMAFSVYEVVCIICHLRIWFANWTDKAMRMTS